MGKLLRETLIGKVKKEQGNIRAYLFDLTSQKGKDIISSLNNIKNTLQRAPHSLQTFVEYVNNLKMCKNQKDNLVEDKKKLEEMNMTLKKFRNQSDG